MEGFADDADAGCRNHTSNIIQPKLNASSVNQMTVMLKWSD